MNNLELAPRFTYSPDGILELRRQFDGLDYTGRLFDIRELLDCTPGYSVHEEAVDSVVQVEVDRVLKTDDHISLDSENAMVLLNNLSLFLYFDYEEKRDGIVCLDFWSKHGAEAIIFPHFQRWLNARGLDENASRNCIKAMAYPLGKRAQKEALKEFRFFTDNSHSGTGLNGLSLGVISVKEKFEVSRFEENDGSFRSENGSVFWNNVTLNTLGSCACWGVSGEERSHLLITSDTTRLYEMSPHNVDYAGQSVSLALGIGSLAYDATRYTGEEDIFEGVDWKPGRW